ncbi:YceI family protein [Lysinibacillus irui]|uniref:YceI family protein n=1 Tax=Lysinibacillus irui TaxID=2998077 RepID=A0AAJ5RI03_9BACI|nr:YceI family protein [Lysinibacillus irui]WDV06527.1 YceI family protein [Lysinibacillus irui]
MKKYTIDFSHSTISFSVRHMMISRIHGTFESYNADIVATNIEQMQDTNISFTIAVASVSTNNYDRDVHLVSPDFFDADVYPKIVFTSTYIDKLSEKNFAIHGDLTIKNITKPIVFTTVYTGKGVNPWAQEVFGFQAKAQIDRRDFNLVYNTFLETGGVLISDEIDIVIDLELNPL